MNNFIFISSSDYYQTPYLDMYESCFEENYDFLFWNRGGSKCTRERACCIPYRHKTATSFDKLMGYVGFWSFSRDVLRNGNYKGVILLQTQPAVMLHRVLTEYYPGRYVCDIRDYFNDDKKPVSTIERILFAKSYANIISSNGYKSFLPEGQKYYLLHNNHNELFVEDAWKPSKGSIRILYIGTIRFFEQCRKTIESFALDERFEICFYGVGAYALRDACRDLDCTNVDFIDEFDPSKTQELLSSADLIFNLYGNHTPLLDYALSNKLYYAAELGKPILVCPDTYMEEIVGKYNLGFTVDLDKDNAGEKLYCSYHSLPTEKFEAGRRAFLYDIQENNAESLSIIKKFLA